MRWKSVDASADVENAESSSIYHVLSSLSHFLFHLTYCRGWHPCLFFFSPNTRDFER